MLEPGREKKQAKIEHEEAEIPKNKNKSYFTVSGAYARIRYSTLPAGSAVLGRGDGVLAGVDELEAKLLLV